MALGAEPVQPRQVLAAVRAFAYDRRLSDRVGAEVQLGIVHLEGARRPAEQIAEVFASLGSLTLFERPVRVTLLDTRAFLADPRKVDVVLLAPDCGERVPEIAARAAESGVLAAGFAMSDVERGAILAVVDGGERLRLVIDLEASRAAGALFGSQLLQLAEIVP